ncbi:hypothetical protein BDV19DRAFT_386322 [Aspergillus venezuelensis]
MDVNCVMESPQGNGKRTPLSSAIMVNEDAATQIINSRSDVDVNLTGPFCRAVEHKHSKVVEALMASGKLDKQSLTDGLEEALCRDEPGMGPYIPLIVPKLIAKGANPHKDLVLAFHRSIVNNPARAKAIVETIQLNKDSLSRGLEACLESARTDIDPLILAIRDNLLANDYLHPNSIPYRDATAVEAGRRALRWFDVVAMAAELEAHS